MELILVKELIGTARQNDEMVTLETPNSDHVIHPSTPVEYRYGSVIVDDYAIDTKHIISIKRG